MQSASFPTHPNKEHVIEAVYTEKQVYHTCPAMYILTLVLLDILSVTICNFHI